MALNRLRTALAAAGSSRFSEYRSFRARVEPVLLRQPRVHRFARPPVLGVEGPSTVPIAVGVMANESGTDGAAIASLAAQTVRPDALVHGSLAQALSETRAPWLLLIDAEDELAAIAIERFAQAAALAPDAALLTCDEDERTRRGRAHPMLRPGPSPDLLLEADVAGGLVCVRREGVASIPDGPAWRYELALRLAGRDGSGQAHVPLILRHGRSSPASPEEQLDAARAIAAERDPRLIVEARGQRRRVRRRITGEPSVDVIVLFRDGADLLGRCARSLLDGTTYDNFKLRLVDNGSSDAGVPELVGQLERDPRVSCVHDARPFNFAALNNAAAAASPADFLLFLNNDTELITPGWIEGLLEHAQRPEVGAVAPLLLFADGTVQHAGAALGMHDYAGHPFAGLRIDQLTPFGTALDGTRNWLAVTAACMLVERQKFERVRGFDERFVVAGNDVDLCLRLTAAGHRSLCVPHVQLLHHEGRSRGAYIDPGDFERSERSYGDFRTVGDPFYNPNLTLATSDCRLRRADEV